MQKSASIPHHPVPTAEDPHTQQTPGTALFSLFAFQNYHWNQEGSNHRRLSSRLNGALGSNSIAGSRIGMAGWQEGTCGIHSSSIKHTHSRTILGQFLELSNYYLITQSPLLYMRRTASFFSRIHFLLKQRESHYSQESAFKASPGQQQQISY